MYRSCARSLYKVMSPLRARLKILKNNDLLTSRTYNLRPKGSIKIKVYPTIQRRHFQPFFLRPKHLLRKCYDAHQLGKLCTLDFSMKYMITSKFVWGVWQTTRSALILGCIFTIVLVINQCITRVTLSECLRKGRVEPNYSREQK